MAGQRVRSDRATRADHPATAADHPSFDEAAAAQPGRPATEAEMTAFRRALAELLAIASERRAKDAHRG